MASIEILAGVDSTIVRSLDWDENGHAFTLFSDDGGYKITKLQYGEIKRIELATEENVKAINKDWTLSNLKSKSKAPNVSGWAATFGMVGIIGETLIKGYDVIFIFELKMGFTIICKTTNKYFDKFMKDFGNVE
jgi:hypothetical protein